MFIRREASGTRVVITLRADEAEDLGRRLEAGRLGDDIVRVFAEMIRRNAALDE